MSNVESNVAKSQTLLVFIPGFMGCEKDWAQVISALGNNVQKNSLTIALSDVPETAETINDYAKSLSVDIIKNIKQTFESSTSSAPKKIVLVGYSMGARLAMAMVAEGHLCAEMGLDIEGLILVGGHPGLDNDTARAQRHQWTQQWLAYMASKPLNEWLNTWYQQSIFEGLTQKQITQQVFEKAALICDKTLRNIQKTMSVSCLSKQNNYHDFLSVNIENKPLNILYVTGEFDDKYALIGEQLSQKNPYLHHQIIKSLKIAVTVCIAKPRKYWPKAFKILLCTCLSLKQTRKKPYEYKRKYCQ
jgi:2-succinyl-6-hydroxy-2,4-cyclohexadiene-1-carboxylate synthase